MRTGKSRKYWVREVVNLVASQSGDWWRMWTGEDGMEKAERGPFFVKPKFSPLILFFLCSIIQTEVITKISNSVIIWYKHGNKRKTDWLGQWRKKKDKAYGTLWKIKSTNSQISFSLLMIYYPKLSSNLIILRNNWKKDLRDGHWKRHNFLSCLIMNRKNHVKWK